MLLNERHHKVTSLSTLTLWGKLSEKSESKRIKDFCSNSAVQVYVRKGEKPSAGVFAFYWWD